LITEHQAGDAIGGVYSLRNEHSIEQAIMHEGFKSCRERLGKRSAIDGLSLGRQVRHFA
jgi:hypothetical protein